jgi:flagellar motor switch protein FliM
LPSQQSSNRGFQGFRERLTVEEVNDAELSQPDSSLASEASFDVSTTRLQGQLLETVRYVTGEFGKRLSAGLGATLNVVVEAQASSLSDSDFAAFLDSLASPRCLSLWTASAQPDPLVVSVDPALASPLLEVLLGGSHSEAMELQGRPYTSIEYELLETPIRALAEAFSGAWQAIAGVEFSPGGAGSGEVSTRGIAPETRLTVLRMRVILEGTTEGDVQLAIPETFWSSIAPAVGFSAAPARATGDQRGRLLRLLEPAQMDLEVRLDGCEVSLSDVLSLQPGKVLLLDESLDTRLTGVLNGSNQFSGQIVVQANRRMFLIADPAGTTVSAEPLP